MPKVSIIMGVYNVEDENILKNSINSILDQTFKDFEFIICDDGSNNNSYELISKLVSHDNRVKILKNKTNLGLAQALNNCLSISEGKYIARMDDDDFSDITRLEEQVKFLDENINYDIVGCNAYLFDDEGIWGERINIKVPEKKDFLFGSRFIHPTIMVRKNVYESLNGYRVSKETVRGQDYDLFMRAYAKGYKGYNLENKLYKYREDKNSYKKRTYKHRINEAIVRYKGFKAMNLMPGGIIYVIKPLIVGLIPHKLIRYMQSKIRCK